jgi:hypothetical protein
LQNNLKIFKDCGIHHDKFFRSHEAALAASRDVDGEIMEKVKPRLLAEKLTQSEVDYLMYLIRHPRSMKREKDRLEKVISSCNRASKNITIIGGTLYAVVRLVLLALAFAALRSVPEGLYTTTWTRFLPNIS